MFNFFDTVIKYIKPTSGTAIDARVPEINIPYVAAQTIIRK